MIREPWKKRTTNFTKKRLKQGIQKMACRKELRPEKKKKKKTLARK